MFNDQVSSEEEVTVRMTRSRAGKEQQRHEIREAPAPQPKEPAQRWCPRALSREPFASAYARKVVATGKLRGFMTFSDVKLVSILVFHTPHGLMA